jgi:hypothetical protein
LAPEKETSARLRLRISAYYLAALGAAFAADVGASVTIDVKSVDCFGQEGVRVRRVKDKESPANRPGLFGKSKWG